MIVCRTSRMGCSFCQHPERTNYPSTCPGYDEAKVCLYYLERFVWPEPCDGKDEVCLSDCFFIE